MFLGTSDPKQTRKENALMVFLLVIQAIISIAVTVWVMWEAGR